MKKKILSLAMACLLLAQPVGIFAETNPTDPTEKKPGVEDSVKPGNDETVKHGENAEEPKDEKSTDLVDVKEIPEIKDEQISEEVVQVGEAINLIDNIKDLPEGATVKDVTSPAIDTKVAGKYTGKVEVTFADGSARIVDIPVIVKLPPIDTTLVGKYLEKVQFVNGVVEGKATIELPKAPEGFAVDANIMLKDASVVKVEGVTTGKQIQLDYSKDAYTVKVKLIRLEDKTETEEAKRDFKCPEIHAPKLNYAYIYDEGLVINVTAEMGIQDIFWAYDEETSFNRLPVDAGYGRRYFYREEKKEKKNVYDFSSLFHVKEEKLDKYTRLNTSDYRINVTVPSVVNVVAVDKLGNKTPMTFKIEKDNIVLTKNVPEDVVKAIKAAMNFTYEGKDGKYEDLIVTEKDTTIDMFETFQKYIIKQLSDFNTRDLEWRFVGNEKEAIPYTGVYKFTKAGVFDVVVTDAESGREAKFTIVVNEGRNNTRSYKVKDKKVEVKGDKFALIDAIEVVKYNDKEKANPLSLIAKIDGKYHKLDEEIAFGDKKEVKATIIDLKANKTYEVTFAKKEEVVVTSNELTDINGHWAEALIRKLVDKKIITGYTDKTFRPNNQITIREALAILGRYAKQNEDHVKPLVEDYKVLPEKDKNGNTPWGYDEIVYAMNRLEKNIFAGQNIDTEYITREQVACVMSNLFNIASNGYDTELSDLNFSQFANEIKVLTSNNIIKGYPDMTFKPLNKITRAELSSLLFNMPAEYK